MSPNGWKWTGGIVAGAAVGGLAVYLATLGWEKAGWVAGVVSMFLAVVGVGLAVAGEVRGRREATRVVRPAAEGSAPGSPGVPSGPVPGSVTNTVSGTTNSGTIIQGGTVTPSPPPTVPETEPPGGGSDSAGRG